MSNSSSATYSVLTSFKMNISDAVNKIDGSGKVALTTASFLLHLIQTSNLDTIEDYDSVLV